jgi:hypothetical protein
VKRPPSLTVVMTMLAALLIHAQGPQSPVAIQPGPATTQLPKAALTQPTLRNGTPIKLKLDETLSSANARHGQKVEFDVLEEVKVAGVTVVPKGGLVCATVTEAEHKKSWGRCGKLTLSIDSVQLADGEKAPVLGKVGTHEVAEDGAVVVTILEFFVKAPLLPFIDGKEITLPRGFEVAAWVNGDMALDMTKFQPPTVPHVAGASSNVNIVVELEQQSQPVESQPKPVESRCAAQPQH